MQKQNRIKLGPLLGIESDYSYTVTFLSEFDIQPENLTLNLKTQSDENLKYTRCKIKEVINKSFVYKFEFGVDKQKENYSVEYSISDKEGHYTSEHASSWKFEVPGIDVVPRIGIASCNGQGDRWPNPQSKNQFSMWKRLRNKFVLEGGSNEVKSFHCLLLTGDQIYADLFWKEIHYFKQHKLLGWRSLFRSSKKIATHKISKGDRNELEEQLNDFYEQIYIKSWSNVDIAATLASVPSVMMWDDHDIFDGWGSHSKELQNSDIFKLVFKVAKDFFEKLQIRGSNNKSRFCIDRSDSFNHYSTRLSFRNFEILSLDNRSHRTRNQIMSKEQYDELKVMLRDSSFFGSATKNGTLEKQKTILFIIPVPVAHLDYSKRSESILKYISEINFQHSLSLGDDALDHWSHESHNEEQKLLFDLIYQFGNAFKPKYIHIISGDVHSAGVGRIKKLKPEAISKHNPSGKDYLRINQLVSSAVVHSPVHKIVQKGIEWSTKQTQDVDGYDIWIDNYGKQNMPKTIYDRNFAYLEKRKGEGLKYYLELESSTTTTGKKHIATDKADYNFDQPAQFENSVAND